MLAALISKIRNHEDLHSFFYTGELILGCLFVGVIFLLRFKTPESNFRVREADLRQKKPPGTPGAGGAKYDALANARIKRVEPLRLSGIRIEGAPHEILGISSQSNAAQIQQAYRDLMKRYHPDRVGPPGTREWKDAQQIAEAINRAKEEMIKKTKS